MEIPRAVTACVGPVLPVGAFMGRAPAELAFKEAVRGTPVFMERLPIPRVPEWRGTALNTASTGRQRPMVFTALRPTAAYAARPPPVRAFMDKHPELDTASKARRLRVMESMAPQQETGPEPSTVLRIPAL